jgi:hypothetical protein
MPFEPQPSIWKFTRTKEPEPVTEVADEVNHPSHYNAHPSGIEAITVTSGFCFSLGNVIKYVWRAGLKNPDPLPDLKKALWYLQFHIRSLEEDKDGGGFGLGDGRGGGSGPRNGAGD